MVTNSDNSLRGIAIIGMAGRFPGAGSVAEFWSNLCNGVESISVLTDEELTAAGMKTEQYRNPDYVRASANLRNADLFDASFFGLSAREAEIIDPQQRVFLECCWDCFEDAAYDPDRIKGAVGVFAGAGMNTYGMANLFGNESLLSGTGGYQLMVSNDKDFLATRVAYKLNLRGPAISVQTACSTSLVAVQMAFESLVRGECDMALAGGVSIAFPQNCGYQYIPGMILSPDGHCRAFDAKAAGTVPGRGCGVVLLKRLQDAVADNDHIYAVIRGAAVNNDGAAKVGYSAPSVEGQSRVITRSMQIANFEPSSIRYVEAHGTGTAIGDPVEVKALTEAFGALDQKQFCALGSVKTNIGHLDTAAGVTGLIKASLALRHRLIPATLHYRTPNPLIQFESSPFYVSQSLLPYKDEEPLRAGVSSFGIGGTNAHVSLEEHLQLQGSSDMRIQLLVLSARSEDALAARCKSLSEYLARNPEISLADVAWTLQDGRSPFRHRKIIVARSVAEACDVLSDHNSSRGRTGKADFVRTNILFLFPGQGSQYVNMGRDLYESAPVFRDAVDICVELLLPVLGFDLRTVLYPEGESESTADAKLSETWVTQPALFVTEYAMAQLCRSYGIQPTAMLGHSVGEFVAACLAGIFSLEDALQLIALRGKLISSMTPGAMMAVSLSEAQIKLLLPNCISVAAINTNSQTVISGPLEEILAFEIILKKRGIETKRLRTSHAFHSAMLDSVVEPFREQVSKVTLNHPTVPIVSNLSGTWLSNEEAVAPEYWARHLRHAVRFADCAEVVVSHPDWIVLEVGPGETLLSFIRQANTTQSSQVLIPCMRQPRSSNNDYEIWLYAVGRTWITGAEINWVGLHKPNAPRRLALPGYPFERQRYWIEPTKVATQTATVQPQSLSKHSDIANWFYVPSWKKRLSNHPQHAENVSQGGIYLLVDTSELAAARPKLVQRLAENATIIQVIPCNTFQQLSPTHFALVLSSREQWDLLLRALAAKGQWPERIIYTVSMEKAQDRSSAEGLKQSFFTLMALSQAIGNVSSTRGVALNIVTSGSYSISGEPVMNMSGASLSGFIKVLAVESPNIRGKVIDVSPMQDTSTDSSLLAELLSSDSEVVSIRYSTRWSQCFEPFPLHSPVISNSKDIKNSTYLITGGLGGLGLVFAEDLARSNSESNFILIGRSPIPPEEHWLSLLNDKTLSPPEARRIERLLNVRAAGGRITTLQADVSNAKRMKEIVSWCNEHYGSISGIIHAAGIPSQSMVLTKTREEALKVFESKVDGTLWIEEFLSSSAAKFVLLCSSISAVVPSPGLSDYATANAYLDAFAAKHDNPDGTRVISVNWDTWAEVGMAADLIRQRSIESMDEAGVRHAITAREGVSVLNRVLSFPNAQIIVSTRDLGLLLEQSRNQATQMVASQADTAPGRKFHSRPDLSQNYVEPTDEIESAVANIWGDLLGIDKIGRFDNFFELGGHSLLGTQVMAKIRQRFGLDLPLRTVFEASTPADLANLLRAIPWATGTSNEGLLTDEDREEIEL